MRSLVLIAALLLAPPAWGQATMPQCQTGLYAEDQGRGYAHQLKLLRQNRQIAREEEYRGEDAQVLADAVSRLYDRPQHSERRVLADRAQVLWVRGQDEVWMVFGRGPCFVAWFYPNGENARMILSLVREDWRDGTY